jgi:hypothetical protein
MIRYQTPGKARPYYALSGSKDALVQFISRQVDIPRWDFINRTQS